MKGAALEYTEKTIQIGNATVTIYRPILSAEERAKREREVIAALERCGKEMYRLEEKRCQ